MAGVTQVAIVDDHPVTARGLADLLGREPGLRVTGTAADLRAGRELLAGRPDVALVDLLLGDRPDGLVLLEEFATQVACVVFSSYDYAGFHARAIDLGARGYLAKTASLSEITAAIRLVAAGGTAFSAGAISDAAHAPRPPSERELDVLRLVARGFSNDEIGARLGLTEKSVESHLRRLFARYAVVSRTELSLLAVRQGWIAAER